MSSLLLNFFHRNLESCLENHSQNLIRLLFILCEPLIFSLLSRWLKITQYFRHLSYVCFCGFLCREMDGPRFFITKKNLVETDHLFLYKNVICLYVDTSRSSLGFCSVDTSGSCCPDKSRFNLGPWACITGASQASWCRQVHERHKPLWCRHVQVQYLLLLSMQARRVLL